MTSKELKEVNLQAQVDINKALQIRWDADRDLVQAMKTIQTQSLEVFAVKAEVRQKGQN